MLNFTVNDKLCTRCRQCVNDCPSRIIEQEGKNIPLIRPAQEEACIQCQHCLAICPAAAISILGRNPGNSLPLAAAQAPSLEQMARFVRSRRSVRQYKDKNVDPQLIQSLLKTLANVPTGVNRRELSFHVIDDKAVMRQLRETVLGELAAAAKANRLPEQMAYLQNAIPLYIDKGYDLIFRGAPHALIVSAPPDAPCPREDVALALAYFELLAQSAGLGTVWWGMCKMVFETLPALKPMIGLPPDHWYYAMLFGIPSIHYARTVQRDDAAVIRKVRLNT
jgi:ferredoxin